MTVFRAILGFLLAALLSAPVMAQELLANRSFEAPVVPADGNNFYTSIAGWSITNVSPPRPDAWNIIRPWSGYGGNPTVTPTDGGIQYADVNGASGTLFQSVTLPSNGMVDLSAWFSVRDFPQALSGLIINVRNSSNVVVASASTSFLASDPIGLWKKAEALNIPLPAGTYRYEIEVADFANVDLASLVFRPAMTLIKTSIAFSDPRNGTTNPKLIPGGVVEYTITGTTPASYTVTSNSILVSDTTPANADFVVTNIGGAGSGPAGFVPGASGLTYTFTSLASTTDDIEFSSDGGTTWVYTPTANANGVDPLVTTVRIRPQGAMAASSNFAIRLRYRIR